MIKQVEASTSLVPLSTFLFKLILTFFSVKLFGFLFISSGHNRLTPPPKPHTIMWQVSLYADQSHSCTLTEGSPIYPHCNGPYYPCHDPYGPQRFKYGIQSVKGRLRSVNCISLVGNIFMARVDIYGLSIRTDRTDRKSDMGSVNCISLEVIHGLPIRTDRADRKSDIRSVKNLFTVRSELHLLVGLRIFSWQERSYTVCRSVRIVRIAKVIYGP